MKIIKEGIPPHARKHQGRCIHCKTEIEFVELEAKRISDQRDGDYFLIKCPVCQQDITKAVP